MRDICTRDVHERAERVMSDNRKARVNGNLRRAIDFTQRLWRLKKVGLGCRRSSVVALLSSSVMQYRHRNWAYMHCFLPSSALVVCASCLC